MRHRNRLFASVLATSLAVPLALSSVLTPAVAVAAVTKASCQVHTVLLSKQGDGTIPAELDFLRTTLENDEFAAYKGFHLVERKTLKLVADVKSEATFGSGHRLALTLLGGDDTRLKLHADLSNRDATKTLLSTDYSIEDNGLLMIGAGNYADAKRTGKLFFAIQCGRVG